MTISEQYDSLRQRLEVLIARCLDGDLKAFLFQSPLESLEQIGLLPSDAL